ncbi:hypothetical protein ABT124_48370 [Streptomyces sp. NPDC001982]|uniref:hypothetical protein n=1 Tax=Streptomyces sp. NPDC001982 TaxID=3154405 RepID=UPI003319C495
MAARAREMRHDETDGEAGEGRQRKRPPPRRSVPAQVRRQLGPQQMLQLMESREEPERR